MLVAPPLVGYGEGCLPEKADQQDHENGQAEGSPVDVSSRRFEQACRWNRPSDDENCEIVGITLRRERKDLLVGEGACDKRQAREQRSGMKAQKTIESLFVFHEGWHSISRKPILVEPDVEKQHHNKAGE